MVTESNLGLADTPWVRPRPAAPAGPVRARRPGPGRARLPRPVARGPLPRCAAAAVPGRRARLGPGRWRGRTGMAAGSGRLASGAVKYGRREIACKLGPLPALRRAAGRAARSWPGQAAE